VMGRILAQVDKKGTFDVRKFTARATSEVLDDLASRPALAKEYRQLKGIVDGWQKLGKGDQNGVSFAKAWADRSDLRKKIGHGEELFPVKEQMDKLRDILTEEIYDQAGRVAGPASKWLQGASRRYRNAEVIEKLAEKQVIRETGNNFLGAGDLGAAIAGGVAFGPSGMVLGLANHVLKSRGGSAFAIAAKKLANSKTFAGVSKNLHSFVRAGLDTAPVWGGAFRAELSRAAAEGADELLATHSQLAKDPTYLASIGLEPESAADADALVGKAEQLDGIAAMLGDVDSVADQELGRLTGQTPGRSPSARTVATPTAQEYNAQLGRLAEMMKTPLEEVPPGLETAPGLAAMMAVTQQRAAYFLDSVAPKPPPGIVPALQSPWAPSATDRRKWAHYLAAVQDPLRLVEQIRNGAVLPETVQAVSSVYPQLMADIQQRMMERLNGYEKALPPRQRAVIERIWGTPSPAKVALLQAAHGGSVSDAGSGPKPDGRQVVDAGKNAQTQAQRIEARGQTL
jgi:hypothetical protein